MNKGKYKKLRSRIIEVYGSCGAFAQAMGRPKGYVSRYLQGHSIFDQNTIFAWCESLQIATADIPTYFFE